MRTIPIGLLAAILFIGTACGDDDGGSIFSEQAEDAGPQDDNAEDGGNDVGGASSNEYPEEVQREFMRNCASQPGAGDATCQCALDYLMTNHPYHEFIVIEQQLTDNPFDTPEPIQNAVLACM